MSEKYVMRSSAVAARMLDGEMLVMSVGDSTLFTLSKVATVIWEAADGRTPLSEIVERRVCAAFQVPVDTAYRDAEEFVEGLASHGILLVSDRPVADAQTAAPESEGR